MRPDGSSNKISVGAFRQDFAMKIEDLFDPNWTEEERRIKEPFLRFWAPALFFLVVWVLSMVVLRFTNLIR